MKADRTVPELFTDLIDSLSSLFRQELQLAKAEAKENVREVTAAATSMAVGGFIALGGLVILLHAAVAWLVWLGMEQRWAALIVGLVAAAIGLLLAYRGMQEIKSAQVTPKRALHQLQRDARVASEQIR
jgi:drug/metabolite transporter (DMT)-like permease